MEWVAASPGLGLSVGGCTQRESKSPDTESFTWFISNRPNSNIGSAPQVGCGEQVWPKTFSKSCLSSKSNYRQTNCTLAVPSIHEILLGHLLGPAGHSQPLGTASKVRGIPGSPATMYGWDLIFSICERHHGAVGGKY